ncbi:branched-chain amino acid transporter AzlD [Butyrivibrio sp. CB08]|uniref:branched-chain amino acid transporter permease n=1 Tax=Butyrivibrio sp. CB08 TaxID=2364879 RepID=UPI000EA85EBF|nr:AzlD domain-containing protein [Butyrivibrio sp. CB08]RKM60334.1 branched-chain amino acid transporter AzlD [Butyrivibrio sp. CB08]
MTAAILIAAMALTTMALRFLPFLIFGKNTPEYISYLGRVLPQAIIALLVVYCLREVSFLSSPFGIPELVAGAFVVGMQVWKRNAVLSILLGTAVYMLLIRL